VLLKKVFESGSIVKCGFARVNFFVTAGTDSRRWAWAKVGQEVGM
jgi:hypothetical protein